MSKVFNDEGIRTQIFEDLVGGPDRGYRLLRIYQHCGSCRDQYTAKRFRKNREEYFRRTAKDEGYTDEQIDAFLELQ
jgi:hypothetical protein